MVCGFLKKELLVALLCLGSFQALSKAAEPDTSEKELSEEKRKELWEQARNALLAKKGYESSFEPPRSQPIPIPGGGRKKEIRTAADVEKFF